VKGCGLLAADVSTARPDVETYRAVLPSHRQAERGFQDHPPRVPRRPLEPAHEQRYRASIMARSEVWAWSMASLPVSLPPPPGNITTA
jgi:hypothetical protein